MSVGTVFFFFLLERREGHFDQLYFIFIFMKEDGMELETKF